MKKRKLNNRGFGLVEALVTMLTVSTIVFVYSTINSFLDLATTTKNTIHAYELAQEEIESLKNISFLKLTNRNQGDLLNVAYNKGTWQIAQDGAEKVYELLSPGSTAGVTGVAIIPGGDYDDFELDVNIKPLAGSPGAWEAGFYFRYQDARNFYRLSYTASSLKIHKSVEGVETQLLSASGLALGTTASYKLITTTTNFTLSRGGSSLGSFTDTSFSRGKIALLGVNGANIYFDKLKIGNDMTVVNGDFNTATTNNKPDGWQRLGINDLPSGIGKLTIEDYGNSDLKRVIVRIEWSAKNRTKNVQLISIISRYGIHI